MINSLGLYKCMRNSNFKSLITKTKQISNQNLWSKNRLINTTANSDNNINSFGSFFGDTNSNSNKNRENEKKATIFASSILVISGLLGLLFLEFIVIIKSFYPKKNSYQRFHLS
jgi:uncharacterized protein YqhQ